MALTNIFTLDLDLKHNNYISEPVVTSNDTVRFVINVTNDSLPLDLTSMTKVTIGHTRSDGIVVLKEGTKTGTNQVSFDFGTTETSVSGRVDAKVQMYDVSGRVSTVTFSYTVTGDPSGKDFVPSIRERTLIEEVLIDGPQILADAEQATTKANTAAGLANTATTNANAARDSANTAAGLANTATTNANAARDAANTAAGLANTATTNANAARDSANTAAGLANTATTNANAATTNANTATTNANAARDAANAAAGSANDATANANAARDAANTATTSANMATDAANAATTNAINATNDMIDLRDSYVFDPDEYDPLKQYFVNNQVQRNGSTYICVRDSLGNLPTNTTYWRLFASKGVDGEGSVVGLVSTDGSVSIGGTIQEPDLSVVQDENHRFVTDTDISTWNVHVNSKGNPHESTKADIGLGNVDNFPTASQAEAEAGNTSNRFMTPLGVRQHVHQFGLGTVSPALSTDLDVEISTGWTTTTSATNGRPTLPGWSTTCLVRTERRTSTRIVQTAHDLSGNDSVIRIARRMLTATGWTDWEDAKDASKLGGKSLTEINVIAIKPSTDTGSTYPIGITTMHVSSSGDAYPSSTGSVVTFKPSNFRAVQHFYDRAGGGVRMRQWDNNTDTWTSWVNLRDASTLGGKGGSEYIPAVASYRTDGSEIDPNTTLEGYILTQHANAPTSGAFYHIRTFFYTSQSASVNRTQVAIGYSTDALYMRRYRSDQGGWQAWVDLRDASTVGGIDSSRIIYGDDSRGTIGYSSDLNNILKTGHYFATTSATNKPDGVNGYVTHININAANTHAMQTFVNVSNDKMFFRRKVSGTWGAWVKFISGGGLQGTQGWSTGADNIVDSGFYYVRTDFTNLPIASNGFLTHHSLDIDSNWALQIYTDDTANRQWMRRKQSGTWQAWAEIAIEGGSVTLAGLTTTGDVEVQGGDIYVRGNTSRHVWFRNLADSINRGVLFFENTNGDMILRLYDATGTTRTQIALKNDNIVANRDLYVGSNKVWDRGDLRTTNGYLEWLDGGEWKTVGSGVLAPSNTVRESANTEQSVVSTAGFHRLVYKFIPRGTGSVKVSFDIVSPAASVNVHAAAGNQAGTTTTWPIGGGAAPSLDYRSAIGTEVANLSGLMNLALLSEGTVATYSNRVVFLNVLYQVPIYITVQATGAKIKNLQFAYDML